MLTASTSGGRDAQMCKVHLEDQAAIPKPRADLNFLMRSVDVEITCGSVRGLLVAYGTNSVGWFRGPP